MPLKIDSAVDLNSFIQAIATDKEAALNKYSNALGIGNYRYAFIKTNATVSTVKEDELVIQIPAVDSVTELILATEYIYGNAIRDASALVEVKDYPNNSDLNSISEEMNKIVRSTILPSFKKNGEKG
jgi:predicted lipoprotein